MKHHERAPLPEIREDHDEQAWTERIADLLREIDRALTGQRGRLILRGGTAAKLGHGLPRPSRDIDADIAGELDVWETFQQGAAQAGMIALAKPDRKRRLKGALVLTDPEVGSTTVQVDMRVLRDPHTLRGIDDGAITEKRNGIRMYKPEQLAQQKFEMATEPGRRRRGKDRYDIAWWLRTRVECVNHAQRVALDQALRFNHDLKRRWDESHARDPVMSRISPDTVHDALMLVLDCDPVVLQHRWPQGQLTVDIKLAAGATLWWGRETERPRTDAIADFATDHELETFMIRMGIWDRSEVPKRLQELNMERQNAIAMAQARSR